jgi:hypothetical protein
MDTASTTSTAASNAQNAVMAVVLLILVSVLLVVAVGGIVTFWKLFTKAGKPGWASIVPVYNLMVMGQIAGYPSWVGITAGVLSVVGGALPVVGPFIGLVVIGMEIYMIVGMMKKYDAGTGFWVLAILLPIITMFTVKNVNYKGDSAPGVAGPQGGVTPPGMQPPAQQPPMEQPPTQQPPMSQPPAAPQPPAA